MDYRDLELHHRRLTENPTDPAAFGALREFFEQQRQNAQLAELYEFRAQHLADARERAQHLLYAASIWLDRENDAAKGMRDLQEAFRADALNEQVGDRLEAAYRDAQDFAGLTALLTERIVSVERLGDVPETARLRSRLYQNLGEIKEKVDGDVKEAIRYYKRAYTVDPTNVLALYLAREIYRRAGDARSAAKLCELEVKAETSAERKAQLLRELALLRADSLGDTDGAVRALEEAVAVAPGDADALYDLAMMLAKRSQGSSARPDDAARAADRLFHLSRIGNPAQTIDYLEYAIDLAPAHEEALESYARLAADTGQIERAAERLRRCMEGRPFESAPVPLLRAIGRIEWDYLRNADAARPIFAALARRGDQFGIAKLQETGGGIPLHARGGEPVAVPEFARPAAPAAPAGDLGALFGDEEEGEAFAPVAPPKRAAPAGEPPTRMVPPDLAEALATAADADAAAAESPAPSDIERLRLEAQRLKMGGKEDKVEAIMERIVEALPGDPEAVAYLERRYRAKGNFPSLHRMLMGAGLNTGLPPSVRIMRLKEAAALAEGRLGDADAAVAAWQRVLAIDPTHGDARRSLERLLRKLERWADLVELMEQLVQLAEDDAGRLALLVRIAGIQETSLKDYSATLDTMWRVQAVDETNPKHLKKIEALSEHTKRWEDLARVLREQADRAEASVERLRAREKLLLVQHERLHAYPEALETVDAILSENPGHVATLRRQIDLFEATGSWEAAADAVDALVARLADKEKPVALRRLAALARTQLGDLSRAADALRRALAIDAVNDEVRDELHRMYEELGQHAEIAASFEEWAKAVRDVARRKTLIRKAAQVLDQQVGDLEAACVRYATILRDGDDPEALEAFGRLHETKGDWAALVDNTVRRANIAPEAEAKAGLLTEAARLLDEQLEQPAKAALVLRRILDEVAPDHHETLRKIVDVQVRAGNHLAAAEALERLRELTDDPDEAIRHSETLGEWYRGPLEAPQLAIETYERIRSKEPLHAGALAALSELYDQVGDFEKLLKVLRARSKAADLPLDQAQLLIEGARIAETRLKDLERAWGWFQEALQRTPGETEIFDAVCEAGRRLERWESLAGVYEAAAARQAPEEDRVRFLREAARVWEQDAKAPLHALEDMVEAVRTVPTDDTLLAECDRIARIGAHWEILGKAYDIMLRRADLSDDRVAMLRRFASVVLDDGRKPEFALGPLVHAMEERPDDEELFDLYDRAARSAACWDDLLRALDKRCRSAADQGRRAELMLRAAEVYGLNMGHVDKALNVVSRAIGQDPFSDELAEHAIRSVRAMEEKLPDSGKGQGWDWLVRTYQKLGASYDHADPSRLVFHRRIVAVHLDGAGEPASAFAAMKAAHLEAPTDEMLVQDLEKLAREHGFLEALADHYAEALQMSVRVDMAKDLHRRRSTILEADLGRAEEAADHYWQLLQLDPDDDDARTRLAGFYEKVGRWNDLVVILEDQLSKAYGDDERVDLLTRIAGIWEDKIGNRYEAIDVYRKLQRLRPDDDEIPAKIKRLAAPRLAGADEEDSSPDVFEPPVMPPDFDAEPEAPLGAEDVDAGATGREDLIEETVTSPAEGADAAGETGDDAPPDAAEPPTDEAADAPETVGDAPAQAAVAAPERPAAPQEPPFLPTWDDGDDSAKLSADQLAWMAAARQPASPVALQEGDAPPEPAGDSGAIAVTVDDVLESSDITGELGAGDIDTLEPAPAPPPPPPPPEPARSGRRRTSVPPPEPPKKRR